MEARLDEMFIEHEGSSESSVRFGEVFLEKLFSSAPPDASNDHQFLEEFKARDEEFLAVMRNYDHLFFKNGVEEARSAAIELAGKKQIIKKNDIVSMFSHAGGWKIGALEEAELLRAMGNQHEEGEFINMSGFQEFLLTTSVGKNASNYAFQPKLPSKLLSVIIEGFPSKTSVAYVNSLCSEYGLIQEVKKLISDSGAKASKHPPPPKFSVTFVDELSASRAVQKLHGFTSKRIPGPVSCQLILEDGSSLVLHASSLSEPSRPDSTSGHKLNA
jgi:hypothetical protein